MRDGGLRAVFKSYEKENGNRAVYRLIENIRWHLAMEMLMWGIAEK